MKKTTKQKYRRISGETKVDPAVRMIHRETLDEPLRFVGELSSSSTPDYYCTVQHWSGYPTFLLRALLPFFLPQRNQFRIMARAVMKKKKIIKKT